MGQALVEWLQSLVSEEIERKSKVRHNQSCVCVCVFGPKFTQECPVAMATLIAGALFISSQALESREWLYRNERGGRVCGNEFIQAVMIKQATTRVQKVWERLVTKLQKETEIIPRLHD